MFTPFAFRTIIEEVVGGLDPDAQAFLTATGITDPTIESAINDLVIDLKDAGIWTKCTAIYPFVGGTATTHKYNLKNPQDTNAAFRLTFVGGMTHNSNGITGNGTNAYANTNMNANSQLNGGAAQNSAHMFYYLRTIPSARIGIDIGVYNSATNTTFSMNSKSSNSSGSQAIMTANLFNSGPAVTATDGVFGASRTSSTQYKRFDNTAKTTITRNSATPPNRVIFMMCANTNGTANNFVDRNMAYVSLGGGLTDTDIDNYVAINQTFQTALGRFV
jgi:hypothetical protein